MAVKEAEVAKCAAGFASMEAESDGEDTSGDAQRAAIEVAHVLTRACAAAASAALWSMRAQKAATAAETTATSMVREAALPRLRASLESYRMQLLRKRRSLAYTLGTSSMGVFDLLTRFTSLDVTVLLSAYLAGGQSAALQLRCSMSTQHRTAVTMIFAQAQFIEPVLHPMQPITPSPRHSPSLAESGRAGRLRASPLHVLVRRSGSPSGQSEPDPLRTRSPPEQLRRFFP